MGSGSKTLCALRNHIELRRRASCSVRDATGKKKIYMKLKLAFCLLFILVFGLVGRLEGGEAFVSVVVVVVVVIVVVVPVVVLFLLALLMLLVVVVTGFVLCYCYCFFVFFFFFFIFLIFFRYRQAVREILNSSKRKKSNMINTARCVNASEKRLHVEEYYQPFDLNSLSFRFSLGYRLAY